MDNETQFPVSGVSITDENHTARVITDKNGVADLSVFNDMDILTFSHVTYVEVEVLKKQIMQSDNLVFLRNKSEILTEVFLSATKDEEKIGRIAEQVAVFSTKDIQLISPQTSADILSEIPGVKVQKTQFGGGSPVLRGMEANRVLLVVDGVRMNNAIYRKGHLQNAITVSPSQLDRVEVIFGPSSVMYGSDALGGVIHYYTRTPDVNDRFNTNFDFLARYATVNNEVTLNGGLELQFKKLASFTSVSYSKFGDLKMGKNRRHGFEDWGKQYMYSDNTATHYNPGPVVNPDPEIQRNIGYGQFDLLQKFYIPLSDKTHLSFNFQYSSSSDIPRFDKLTEINDGTLKYAEWRYGPQERLLLASRLEINPDRNWLKKGFFTLAFQDISESRIKRKFGSLDRSSQFENVNIFSLNGDFSVPLLKDNNRNLGYGFEIAYNNVRSTSKGEVLEVNGDKVTGVSDIFRVQTRYPDGGSNYMSSAVYADYRQDISDKSTLNTGLRLTNTILNATWIDETYIKLPDKDIHLSNTSLTATLGYTLKPAQSWQLNAVLSSGFRSPNIDDIGKVREKRGKVTVPNVHLKPEYAYNAEIGVQKYFNDKNYLIGATAYYTLLNNYIYRVAFELDGSSTIIYDGEELETIANVNMGNAYITGSTFLFKAHISENFSGSGSVTFTKGRAYDTGKPLSSIPPAFGDVAIEYAKNRFLAGINFRFNGMKSFSQYNLEEGIDNIEETPYLEDKGRYYGSPAWNTLNFYSKYQITKNIDFLFSADNIFDVHYKEFASAISAPGRNFSFTVMANF